jgi:hypothetical protein
LLAAACAAAARIPICMLSLERTDDDILVGCLLARRIPSKSCCFSSLREKRHKQTQKQERSATRKREVMITHALFYLKFQMTSSEAGLYLTKMTESPASSFLPLTKRLQPVVSRCRLG